MKNEELTTQNSDSGQSFWDHLDVLRACLVRIFLAIIVAAIVAFLLKDELFAVVLAPSHADFPLYRLFPDSGFSLHLINTGLTEQFMIHLKVAAAAGVLVASPYILYVVMGFINPALYENERRYSLRISMVAYLMFMLGVVVCYGVIFPLTVRFLGTYQVSAEVGNMLTISSYIDTLVGMSLVMGVVFELPVVSWMMALAGLLRAEWMAKVRRHAIVAILVVAAIITPTADIFTLLVVSLPIYLLYEVSIWVVKMARKR